MESADQQRAVNVDESDLGGWMGGWVDGWVDGWMDRSMDR